MMTDEPHYTLEGEIEEAEAAARELPEQIARLRERVRRAKVDLASGKAASGESSGT